MRNRQLLTSAQNVTKSAKSKNAQQMSYLDEETTTTGWRFKTLRSETHQEPLEQAER